ncbi:WD repeat-containing protein mio [Oopsacas minuta]|uniref:WD repeat-containing protein mio n=1 Tax=Oopsacas minuta TaxID=111878 RepID=A0AAV7K2Z0_9METZ|nr:WD repeat-containing protein mio [Oopsacas minuta]
MSFTKISYPVEIDHHSKLELHSSPNDKYEIASFTPVEISVFRLETISLSDLKVSNLPLSLVSTRPTRSYLIDPTATAVCVAWKPDKNYKYIFAVGFSNAKVILLNLSPDRKLDIPTYINDIFQGGGFKRACTSMAWNPTQPNYLAIGYPKIHKPDQSLRIWDITKLTTEGNNSLYPVITTGHLNALSWVADSAQHLVYSNLGGVGLYDFSQAQLGKHNKSKVINGICTDNLSKLYAAGYCDCRVRVWSLEAFNPNFFSFHTQHPVVSICWSLLRHSTLIVMTSYPEIYQLTLPRHESGIINAATTEEGVFYPTPNGQQSHDFARNLISEKLHDIHIMHPDSRFTFLPHPTIVSAIIILLPSTQSSPPPTQSSTTTQSSIKSKFLQVILHSHTVLAMSPQGPLARASDINLSLCYFPHHLSPADTIHRRIQAGYCFSPVTNLRVCTDMGSMGEELVALWEWLGSMETGLEGRGHGMQLGDVMLNGLAANVLCLIQTNKHDYEYCDVSPDPIGDRGVSPCWHYSPNREMSLRLLGWLPSGIGDDLTERLLSENKLGKAVLQIVISESNTGVRRAIQLLRKVASSERDASIAAMALAGYPSCLQNKYWIETCINQATTLTDPYLRLCVRILYSHYSDLYNIIRNEHIPANDKFILACSYLSDKDLDRFRTDLLKEIETKSLLEGLFLTGLGTRGIPIMRKYLLESGDLLTVCILSSMTLKYSLDMGSLVPPEISKLIDCWWGCLCDYMDRTRLWKERCRLQIARNKLLNQRPPDDIANAKWYIQCGYCGKRISGDDRKELRGRKLASIHLSTEKNVSTSGSCCPSCYKPLPRCVVCHRHMGSSAEHVPNGTGVDSKPTDDWITWCQTCGHWGHSKHLSDWFKENTCCPSPCCSCQCIWNDK